MGEIQKLTEEHKGALLEYAEQESEYNLFIMGDLYNYGFENPQVSYYALLDDSKAFQWILVRYFTSLVFYSHEPHFDAKCVSEFIKEVNPEFDALSGKGALIESLAGYFPEKIHRKTQLSTLREVRDDSLSEEGIEIRKLGEASAEELIELYCKVPEFKDAFLKDKQEHIRRKASTLGHSDTYFGAFRKKELIGAAGTSAETPKCAMIVGVAVLPRLQKRGIGSALVSLLCQDALRRGMEFVCLFYDNPNAAKMYRKVGFEPMGEYGMLQSK